MWVFPQRETEHSGLLPTTPDVYRDSIPVAGVLDPDTKALDPDHGSYHYFASRQVWKTKAGYVLRCLTNGGGGWGDPFARDPQRVLADVRDEYVSVEGAARDYGVVVVGDPQTDPEGLQVDREATEKLRGQLRAHH
jgi:N-methylhydantoinase B